MITIKKLFIVGSLILLTGCGFIDEKVEVNNEVNNEIKKEVYNIKIPSGHYYQGSFDVNSSVYNSFTENGDGSADIVIDEYGRSNIYEIFKKEKDGFISDIVSSEKNRGVIKKVTEDKDGESVVIEVDKNLYINNHGINEGDDYIYLIGFLSNLLVYYKVFEGLPEEETKMKIIVIDYKTKEHIESLKIL